MAWALRRSSGPKKVLSSLLLELILLDRGGMRSLSAETKMAALDQGLNSSSAAGVGLQSHAFQFCRRRGGWHGGCGTCPNVGGHVPKDNFRVYCGCSSKFDIASARLSTFGLISMLW